MGNEEIIPAVRILLRINKMAKAQLVSSSQSAGLNVTDRPVKVVEDLRSSKNIKCCKRELKKTLFDTYFRRTLDQAQAVRLTQEAWKRLGLPIIPE